MSFFVVLRIFYREKLHFFSFFLRNILFLIVFIQKSAANLVLFFELCKFSFENENQKLQNALRVFLFYETKKSIPKDAPFRFFYWGERRHHTFRSCRQAKKLPVCLAERYKPMQSCCRTRLWFRCQRFFQTEATHTSCKAIYLFAH